MDSFTSLISDYGRAAISEDCSVSIGVVKQWERRGNIPPEYWPGLIAGAQRRQRDEITGGLLISLARPRKRVTSDAPSPEAA